MSENEEEKRKELKAYLDNLDANKELLALTHEVVLEDIQEEWQELFAEDGISRDAVTSIILFGHHKWLSLKKENALFAHRTLLDINLSYAEEENDQVVTLLRHTIADLERL